MSSQSAHNSGPDDTQIAPSDTFGANLKRQQWQDLDEEAQDLWEQLSSVAKDIITARATSNDSARPPRPDNHPPTPPTPSGNIHTMSIHDITAHLHALEVGRDHVDDAYQANQHAETPAALSGQPKTSVTLTAGTAPTAGSEHSPENRRKEPQEPWDKFSSEPRRKVNSQHTKQPPTEYQDNMSSTTSHRPPSNRKSGSLVDRGANGGIAGQDSRKISGTGRTVTVTGICGHQIHDLEICNVGGVVDTQRGLVVVIMNQYAYSGKGETIHSSIQMENHQVGVDDKSRRIGGTQSINTPDDYTIPLYLIEGLTYMKLRPYTDYDWKILPHVTLTSDEPWNPPSSDEVAESEAARTYDPLPSLPTSSTDTNPVHDYSLEVIPRHTQLYRNMYDHGSAIDLDCTRGVAGADVRLVHRTSRTADITKVLGNYIPGLEICTVGALVQSLQGPAILFMQEYAYSGIGRTVHSWNQVSHGCPTHTFAFTLPQWGSGNDNVRIEVPQRTQFNSWSGCFADDRSLYSYDEPYDADYSENVIIPTCLRTKSNSHTDIDIILEMKDGVAHIQMKPYTDEELKNCDHRIVYLTSDESPPNNDLLDMVLTHVAKRGATRQDIMETPARHHGEMELVTIATTPVARNPGETESETLVVTNPHGETHASNRDDGIITNPHGETHASNRDDDIIEHIHKKPRHHTTMSSEKNMETGSSALPCKDNRR